MRVITLAGTQIKKWPGVQVWRLDNRNFYHDVTANWDASTTAHHHYEVVRLEREGGSYYCPASTHPPYTWQYPVDIVGTTPPGYSPVNPSGTEQRPTGTYFWIPDSAIPATIFPGNTSNTVICNCPTEYPPANPIAHSVAQISAEPAMQNSSLADKASLEAFDALNEILSMPSLRAAAADDKQKAFSDSDGLVSFVNLSSGFVSGNPQFITGRNVCDKIASFFATLRQNVYAKQIQDPKFILPGDGKPKDQWDLPVTHKMQKLLIDAGGLSAFKITTETVSNTQVIAEFSTDFVKLIFDVAIVPANVLTSVTKFIQGVGTTLRTSWDDRARSFSTTLLGQCHEAVPVDDAGKTTVYIPKVKYFHINVNATQTAFTTPCSKVEKITFDFKFENYVTALKATILDETSSDYKKFVAFLDKAQRINYQDADNSLDAILDNAVSTGADSKVEAHRLEELSELGIAASEYPQLLYKVPRVVERLLKSPGS